MANRTNHVWGIGFNDKGKYTSRRNGKHTKVYCTWICMLQRCYDEELHERNKTYRNCRVCEEWLSFQNFGKWFDDNYTEGYQLDKDLLVKGNKLYSPETCCFIPKELNLLIIRRDPETRTSDLPLGLQWWRKGIRVKLRINNKQKHVGCYNTIENAFTAYKTTKETHIIAMAEKYKGSIDNRAYEALLNYTIDIKD